MKSKKLQDATLKPFLKWAGGKRSLLSDILSRIPDGPIETYVEPFLGGGALFLELARQGRIGNAILNDRNPEVVHTWRVVRDEPERLIEAIGRWTPDEETYYQVRALDVNELSDVERAARVLWLNRTCYNGLYRINRSGQFNVPFGRYKKVQLVNADNLMAVSEALQNVTLYDIDFEGILAMAGPGALVYCDPPYWPMSSTANFTAYDGQSFKEDDQERLARAFRELRGQGAHGVLSNSWTSETVALYERHELFFSQVYARRSINRDASKRGPVPEIMVTTHPWEAVSERPKTARVRPA